ncbi:hypothetical protein [Corticimicrobacter populi]|nr:hypothetical protein [Corticimicrobacter populi]
MAYKLQIAETNAYMGYVSFPIDFEYLFSVAVALVFSGLLMPLVIYRPSDFFGLIYVIFVLLPYMVLYPIRGHVALEDFFLYFFVLSLPVMIVRLVSALTPRVGMLKFIDSRTVVGLLFLLCIFGLIYALANPPGSAGFDLASAYDRRLEGREIFTVGSVAAYLNSAIVNGFAPFLAFVAGWRKRSWLLMFAMACGIGYFYLLGLKAPLLFIVLAYIIGYAARFEKIYMAGKIVCFLLVFMFLAFFVEYVFFGFSQIGDYFIRRAFGVSSYIVSAYFEFMNVDIFYSWSMLDGVESVEPITFLVGEWFLGAPGLNANTNTFVHQLAAGGVVMYGGTIILVALVFSLLDAVYLSSRNPAVLYVGLSYAILLTEQAASTALVSSGIGFLILLLMFSRVEDKNMKIRLIGQ